MKLVTTKQRIKTAKVGRADITKQQTWNAEHLSLMREATERQGNVQATSASQFREARLFTIYCHVLAGFHANVGAINRSASSISKEALKGAQDAMFAWEKR